MLDVPTDDLEQIEKWHFAVGGLQTSQARLPINKAIELRRLASFPQPAELASSLRDLTTAGFMSHYGEAVIRHELVFDASMFEDYEAVIKTAGLVIAALRIRTEGDIICPAVCERSWQNFGKPTGELLRAYCIEQVMLGHRLDKAYAIVPDDLDWVARALSSLWQMTVEQKEEDERFSIAVEALCSYLHAGNYRMMATQLWGGIDAIFDVQMEVKYRIATLAARLLEPHGPRCRDRFNQIKSLYDDRSKAVHGRRFKENKLRTHVAEVRSLLAQLLARLIAIGKVPTKEEFDDLVFLPEKPTRNPDES